MDIRVGRDARTSWNPMERTITFEDGDRGRVEVADGDEVGIGGGSGVRPDDERVAAATAARPVATGGSAG